MDSDSRPDQRPRPTRECTKQLPDIGVAAIAITQGTLSVGDMIHIKAHTGDFTQTVDFMQIEGASVQQAFAGQDVGLRVTEHAREHGMVYKVTD